MPVVYPLYLDTPVYEYENVTDSLTNCTAGVQWIFHLMGECVINDRQYASVISGIISLLIWMTVGIPQIYKNCKDPIALEGLSLLFLIQWLLGDSTNLIGCIFTSQLPVQTYTAVYYVFADILLISQFAYYKAKKYYRKKEIVTGNAGSVPHVVLCIPGLMALSTLLTILNQDRGLGDDSLSISIHKLPAGRTLLGESLSLGSLRYPHIFKGPLDIAGYIIGLVSCSFYVGSRLSQIYRNWRRKSTEGVSVFLFILAVLGNMFYGMAVLLQSTYSVYLIRHMPWIIGSFGIMFFDISILGQFVYYKRRNRVIQELGVTDPLINNGSTNDIEWD